MAEDRNSIYESRGHHWSSPTTIDMEFNHPAYGWIPTTTAEYDEETLALFLDGLEAIGPNTGEPPPPAQLSEEQLTQARATKTIGKPELIYALVNDLKLISEEEGLQAAKSGDIPSAFAPIFEAMSPQDKLMAKLKWAGDANLSRNNPLLVTFAQAVYGSNADNILDAIFGIGEAP